MAKMTKAQKTELKLFNLLDGIDKLEHGDNFIWALQTDRMPTMLQTGIWEFTGEAKFLYAIRALARANTRRKGFNYPKVITEEIGNLVARINTEWVRRT